MNDLTPYLQGGGLRSTGEVEQLLPLIKTQQDFDELFRFMFSEERLVAMRAADAVEKIALRQPDFLQKHKAEVLHLLPQARHIEFKWHLALLVSRLPLAEKESQAVWAVLKGWAMDASESKIVRVNSLQAMSELYCRALGFVHPGYLALASLA
ncbi:MAG: hypothetical protein EPO28_10695 [Saprospiraceae bacterium]|nr:MAG: hypothetical protein EPO28_10695 [Saprospiraceae bacterium]